MLIVFCYKYLIMHVHIVQSDFDVRQIPFRCDRSPHTALPHLVEPPPACSLLLYCCATLQAQLTEEEQYHRRIEGERDREKAMRQAAESQASIWRETGKKMRRDLERLLTQEEQRRRNVEMDKAHNQRRAAEVDMTEVQLRREAEQKLSKVLMSALSVCCL